MRLLIFKYFLVIVFFLKVKILAYLNEIHMTSTESIRHRSTKQERKNFIIIIIKFESFCFTQENVVLCQRQAPNRSPMFANSSTPTSIRTIKPLFSERKACVYIYGRVGDFLTKHIAECGKCSTSH